MGRIRNSAAGFTLLELVLAMAVMTILVGGMASAGLVARHALPDESDPAEKTACALDVCHQLAADLATAVTVIQASESNSRSPTAATARSDRRRFAMRGRARRGPRSRGNTTAGA